MQIAAVAIVQDHTLVTHNVAHFRHIPGLRIDDWLAP
jgi:predicted nucleic acid-binding protein